MRSWDVRRTLQSGAEVGSRNSMPAILSGSGLDKHRVPERCLSLGAPARAGLGASRGDLRLAVL